MNPALAARAAAHDPRDPDPWLALELDQSLPIDEEAKASLVRGNASYSRMYLAPFLKPFVLVFFALVHLLRRPFAAWPSFPGALHASIVWGLKTFATPDANRLILRHFQIGTEIIAFIRANAGPVEAPTVALRPRRVDDLRDNVFLQHDLNIFNFIIGLNAELRSQGRELEPVAEPDFSTITDGPFDIEDSRRGPLNFVDIQTAVEVYTPVYALFLPKRDFVRAANSLQLDEVIAIYLARILGTDYHLSFVKNGHPLAPLSTFQAGYRLMMHGLDCEALHGWLREMKRRQAAGLPLRVA